MLFETANQECSQVIVWRLSHDVALRPGSLSAKATEKLHSQKVVIQPTIFRGELLIVGGVQVGYVLPQPIAICSWI